MSYSFYVQSAMCLIKHNPPRFIFLYARQMLTFSNLNDIFLPKFKKTFLFSVTVVHYICFQQLFM